MLFSWRGMTAHIVSRLGTKLAAMCEVCSLGASQHNSKMLPIATDVLTYRGLCECVHCVCLSAGRETNEPIENSRCSLDGQTRVRPSIHYYSTPTAERSIVMSASVCPRYVRHIFGIKRPIFAKCFVHVTYGRGSILIWQHSDTLCTSGFIDDVIFAHKPRLLDVAVQLKRSAHAALGLIFGRLK